MTHGDNKGAILPPYVAPIQIVIVPIGKGQELLTYSNKLFEELNTHFRVHIDTSDHTPGWKFNYWEMNGVPLRIEIGKDELNNNSLTLFYRHNLNRQTISCKDDIITLLKYNLKSIHDDLYTNAYNKLYSNIAYPQFEVDFDLALTNKKLCLLRWCGSDYCEQYIKNEYKAKSLCIPLDLPVSLNDANCLFCKNKATMTVLFGRSF